MRNQAIEILELAFETKAKEVIALKASIQNLNMTIELKEKQIHDLNKRLAKYVLSDPIVAEIHTDTKSKEAEQIDRISEAIDDLIESVKSLYRSIK